jgi:carboxymethylenebutenolidase
VESATLQADLIGSGADATVVLNEEQSMPEVMIPTRQGDVPAYFAKPVGTGPVPGVVVIHDIIGMSTDLRNHADCLAGEGYLAVAPDLFHWGGKFACIRAVMRETAARQGRSFDDIEAVRT